MLKNARENSKRRVVVTGLGLVTALGIDVEESWRKALAGVPGIHRITYPGAEKSPVQAVGEVSSSDWQRITEEFKQEAATEGERKTLFALWAVRRALEDASVGNDLGSRDRHGVVMASGLGINRLEDIHRWITTDKRFDVVRERV
jgi:3-oxoacyl-[acyl-carrier-protein] synthase II